MSWQCYSKKSAEQHRKFSCGQSYPNLRQCGSSLHIWLIPNLHAATVTQYLQLPNMAWWLISATQSHFPTGQKGEAGGGGGTGLETQIFVTDRISMHKLFDPVIKFSKMTHQITCILSVLFRIWEFSSGQTSYIVEHYRNQFVAHCSQPFIQSASFFTPCPNHKNHNQHLLALMSSMINKTNSYVPVLKHLQICHILTVW